MMIKLNGCYGQRNIYITWYMKISQSEAPLNRNQSCNDFNKSENQS